MEPLFSNTCLLTKEVYKEAYFAITKRKRILVVILSVIVIITSILEANWLDDIIFYFCAGFFLLFSVYYFILFPRRAVNITYKRNQEVYHEEISCTVTFYDDKIVMKSIPSNAEATLQYSQIVRIRATRQLYILTIKQNLLFFLDKSQFDHVNMFEFEHFMRQKALKAKFYL